MPPSPKCWTFKCTGCNFGNFVKWCEENHLQLNVAKTKEMVVDLRRNKPPPSPVCIGGADINIVDAYKYLGVVLE